MSDAFGKTIGVIGLFGVALVLLKLCGVVDWPWWLVTLPFWGGATLAVVIMLAYFAWFARNRE